MVEETHKMKEERRRGGRPCYNLTGLHVVDSDREQDGAKGLAPNGIFIPKRDSNLLNSDSTR